MIYTINLKRLKKYENKCMTMCLAKTCSSYKYPAENDSTITCHVSGCITTCMRFPKYLNKSKLIRDWVDNVKCCANQTHGIYNDGLRWDRKLKV